MEKAVWVLLGKYYKLWWILFWQYLMEYKWNDDVKKTAETMRFMQWLMDWNLEKEWKLENKLEFKEMEEIVKAINILQK